MFVVWSTLRVVNADAVIAEDMFAQAGKHTERRGDSKQRCP